MVVVFVFVPLAVALFAADGHSYRRSGGCYCCLRRMEGPHWCRLVVHGGGVLGYCSSYAVRCKVCSLLHPSSTTRRTSKPLCFTLQCRLFVFAPFSSRFDNRICGDHVHMYLRRKIMAYVASPSQHEQCRHATSIKQRRRFFFSKRQPLGVLSHGMQYKRHPQQSHATRPPPQLLLCFAKRRH
jgi:hypothetical protein